MDSNYLQSLKKLAGNLKIIPAGPGAMSEFDFTNFPLAHGQALYVMSIKDEILVYQRNILELLGYHEKEFRFDNIFSLMHREDKPIVETIVKNTLSFSQKYGLSEKAVLYLTYRIRHKDGRYIKVQRISGVCCGSYSPSLDLNYSILQDISYMRPGPEVRYDWKSPTLNREAYEKYIRVLPQDLFSKREMQIYDLLMAGDKSSEIAEKLGITVNTVKSHKHKMAQKAGVDSSADLVRHFENQAFQKHPWQ